jgi:hypothetical protein
MPLQGSGIAPSCAMLGYVPPMAGTYIGRYIHQGLTGNGSHFGGATRKRQTTFSVPSERAHGPLNEGALSDSAIEPSVDVEVCRTSNRIDEEPKEDSERECRQVSGPHNCPNASDCGQAHEGRDCGRTEPGQKTVAEIEHYCNIDSQIVLWLVAQTVNFMNP